MSAAAFKSWYHFRTRKISDPSASKVDYERMFASLFSSLDRDDLGSIEVAEIVAALAICCEVDADATLEYVFSLFDEDSTGFLSRIGLFKMLRCLLSSVLQLSFVRISPSDSVDVSADQS